jgi:hypothetical protein
MKKIASFQKKFDYDHVLDDDDDVVVYVVDDEFDDDGVEVVGVVLVE